MDTAPGTGEEEEDRAPADTVASATTTTAAEQKQQLPPSPSAHRNNDHNHDEDDGGDDDVRLFEGLRVLVSHRVRHHRRLGALIEQCGGAVQYDVATRDHAVQESSQPRSSMEPPQAITHAVLSSHDAKLVNAIKASSPTAVFVSRFWVEDVIFYKRRVPEAGYPYAKQSILKNYVIRAHEKLSIEEKEAVWALGRAMGAVVIQHEDKAYTNLVIAKVHDERFHNRIPYVCIAWLRDCFSEGEFVNVGNYLILEDATETSAKPVHSLSLHTPQHERVGGTRTRERDGAFDATNSPNAPPEDNATMDAAPSPTLPDHRSLSTGISNERYSADSDSDDDDGSGDHGRKRAKTRAPLSRYGSSKTPGADADAVTQPPLKAPGSSAEQSPSTLTANDRRAGGARASLEYKKREKLVQLVLSHMRPPKRSNYSRFYHRVCYLAPIVRVPEASKHPAMFERLRLLYSHDMWERWLVKFGARCVRHESPMASCVVADVYTEAVARMVLTAHFTALSPFYLYYSHVLGANFEVNEDAISQPAPIIPSENLSLSLTGYAGVQRQYAFDLAFHLGFPCPPSLRNTTSLLICHSGVGKKYSFARDHYIPRVHLGWLRACAVTRSIAPIDEYTVEPNAAYNPQMPWDSQKHRVELKSASADTPRSPSHSEPHSPHHDHGNDNDDDDDSSDDEDADDGSLPKKRNKGDEKPAARGSVDRGDITEATPRDRQSPANAQSASSINFLSFTRKTSPTKTRPAPLSGHSEHPSTDADLPQSVEKTEQLHNGEDPEARTPLSMRHEHADVSRTLQASTGRRKRVRIAFTSIGAEERTELVQKAKQMGFLIVDAGKCTHLIIGEPTRTANFLRALCVCDYVVRASWLRMSYISGRILPERQYSMCDYEFEQNFNFTLRQSLESQKICGKGKLFKGMTFYCTPNVGPPQHTLTEIVQAGGGKVLQGIPTVAEIEALMDISDEDEMHLIVSCPDDLHLLRHVAQTLTVYTSEIILSSALHQKVTLEPWKIDVPESGQEQHIESTST